MNNLSRNKPVGLIVGAAGFIGSHLTEELLKKGIQVIGVDDLSGGSRDNLIEATKDTNFQFISQPLSSIVNIAPPRIDYAFFIITEDMPDMTYRREFATFLDICSKYKPKIIFCSSINLYDAKLDGSENIKLAERKLAEEARDKNLNARVVRLAAVYGARMNFRDSDPMVRLIKSAVQSKLNTEQTPLEFTTRALYIGDAVNLLIKAMMHGFTSQKIYDAAVTTPIKVLEIKQILMDPLWYEEKGFTPTELPPWPTPNLLKTSKELSWKPRTGIISALKDTMAFFDAHPDKLPVEKVVVKKESIPWQFSKLEEEDKNQTKEKPKKEAFISIDLKPIKNRIIVAVGVMIIFYTLIFPPLYFIYSVWSVKFHLENSINQIAGGNFDSAFKEAKESVSSMSYLNNTAETWVFLKQFNFSRGYFETFEKTLMLGNDIVNANIHTVAGATNLATGLSVIAGGKEGDVVSLLNDAKTELETADSGIGEAAANLSDSTFTGNWPSALQPILKDITVKSDSYRQTIDLGKSLADLLPGIIALNGEKNYLVVFSDNRILRPGGGQLRSYVQVTFKSGKLTKITGDSVENLDRQFNGTIEPPVELKNDLGLVNWRLSDAAYDPDFSTSAKNIAWFYTKESGVPVAGVVSLDLSAATELLQAIGPENVSLNIPITRDGNQPAAEALKTLVERVFYLSKQNWVTLVKNSGASLVHKDLSVYLSDPNAFSYLSSLGWTGVIPPQTAEKIGERNEFLSLSETNMSQGQDSTTIQRAVSLNSKIDESGMVSHKLSVDYTASDKLTGPYKNRLKVYLPGGTKMIKATWGGIVIKDLATFSDFGRNGYSMLLDLGVGEEKQLVLEFQDTNLVKFDNNLLKYQLSFIKQTNAAAMPFDFKLTIPEGIKAKTSAVVKDNLSEDKTFTVDLIK